VDRRSVGREPTQRLEELAQDTSRGHEGEVGARAALEQAEELRRVLEELGEELGI
jgi:hypothetical protein